MHVSIQLYIWVLKDIKQFLIILEFVSFHEQVYLATQLADEASSRILLNSSSFIYWLRTIDSTNI